MIDRNNINTTLLVGTLVVIALVIAIGVQASSVVRSIMASGDSDTNAAEMIARLHTASETALETDKARFDGRSVYRKPLKTVVVKDPPPPPPPKNDDEDENDAPPPPPPPQVKPQYDGPSVRAMIGDTVLFAARTKDDAPDRIKVGEEKNGLKVVSTDPPWRATVEWKGWDYELELFSLNAGFLEGTDELKGDLPGLIEAKSEEAATEASAAEVADDEAARARAEADGTETADDGGDDPEPNAMASNPGKTASAERNAATPIDRARTLGPRGGPDER